MKRTFTKYPSSYVKASSDNVIYKFTVGQNVEAPMLYGGTVYYTVVSRTPNTVTVQEYHISEDTGDTVDDGISTHDIEYQNVYDYSDEFVDGKFKVIGLAEVFKTWEYGGYEGCCSSNPNTY